MSSIWSSMFHRMDVLRGMLAIACLSGWMSAASPDPAPTEIHLARGVLRRIGTDQRTAVIRHEPIPNYMPAMTMELTVKDPHELEGLKVGDTITFRLLATDETHWIDTLKRVDGATNVVTAADSPLKSKSRSRQELKKGEVLPDFEMRTEFGTPLLLSSLRGQAVAITFIFTRCPLPDFCPLMSRNFSRARTMLQSESGSSTNWHFLSISFDPDFDTPEVLARYAQSYRGQDSSHWTFAAASHPVLEQLAPKVDLMYYPESGSIVHNLRTVVLDTRGRIHQQFDSNQWKASELANALSSASRVTP
mgnify:CR=1 FL=1